jgi:hypothetical protein
VENRKYKIVIKPLTEVETEDALEYEMIDESDWIHEAKRGNRSKEQLTERKEKLKYKLAKGISNGHIGY